VSEELWVDPRDRVRPNFSAELTTGTMVPLVMVFNPSIKAGIVLLGGDEVEITRDRWSANQRVLDELSSFSFLTSGKRTGEVGEDA
jgi:hypothetical protein